MQLHQLKPKHKLKPPKRVGRGGKKGTYSGRGMKGQKARAGTSFRPGFAGGDTPLVMRLPNKKGFIGHLDIRHGVKLGRFKSKPITFNLKDLDKNFEDGETVSPETLEQKGMIEKINKRKYPEIKILGSGETEKKLTLKEVEASKSVKDKLKIK